MSKFAKLIELEDKAQVLLTLSFNPESEDYEVIIRTDIEAMETIMTFGFKKKEKALKLIKEFTLDRALRFRNELISNLT